MTSASDGASAGQFAASVRRVLSTCAGRMLRETSPNESTTATLLRWFGHLFAYPGEGSAFAPGQAPEAGARNFFQERINLGGDELLPRHLPAAFALQTIRGLGIAAMDVASATLIQREVSRPMQGRTFANLYGAIGLVTTMSSWLV